MKILSIAQKALVSPLGVALATGIHVPDDYPTIQEAIEGGWPGEGNVDADPLFWSYRGFPFPPDQEPLQE
ncbi:MAG: hypothetical protein CME06_07440 [Gemmatimonadetes bacterium]|nr:hypothetical protein [Gemmatimonadota bacterium]